MKKSKAILLLALTTLISSCASGYKMIQPESIRYKSSHAIDKVVLDYKYNVLQKKYAKKEAKKGINLVAVKVTNYSDRDLTFGKDITLVYENGNMVPIIENEKVFKELKQSTASYLLYLLLTPLNINTSDDGGGETSSTPIGLVIGPGLVGGNMIAAGSANKKFKEEILEYNLNGTVIKKKEIGYGLIGIRNDSYDALKLKVN